MKTLAAIIFNLLGIVICFLIKYIGRKEQDKSFSLSFWIKDNRHELLVIALVDAAVLGLLLTGDITVNASGFVPEWMTVVGNNAISLLLGLGLSATVYEVIKKKIIYSKEG